MLGVDAFAKLARGQGENLVFLEGLFFGVFVLLHICLHSLKLNVCCVLIWLTTNGLTLQSAIISTIRWRGVLFCSWLLEVICNLHLAYSPNLTVTHTAGSTGLICIGFTRHLRVEQALILCRIVLNFYTKSNVRLSLCCCALFEITNTLSPSIYYVLD